MTVVRGEEADRSPRRAVPDGTAGTDPSRELARRLGVAAVGIPLCAAVVYAGGWVFALGLGTLAAVAMTEYVRLFASRGPRPFGTLGVIGAGGFPLAAYAVGPESAWALAAGYLVLLSGAALTRDPAESPVRDASLTLFGVLYVGGLLAFGVPLREGLVEGRLAGTLLFFLPVAVTWVVDTSAYFGGRAWGRRQLASRISPKKTVEGAAAALAAGPLAAGAYGVWVLDLGGGSLSPLRAAALGLLLAGAAILGDLVESILKRECGAKDSSSLLPGHGGLLDRLDSLLWTFPVAYLFLRVV